ncbi:MAG: glycosyltransferase family 4 protein [Gemmataceae bacterium]|nr:glycosyltransferase family 4 protein [Gemmataceae bacterium]
MRVIYNRTSAWEAKTGVGHYATQLYRGLRRHAGEVRIDCYPNPWIWMARRAWERFRPPHKQMIDVRRHDLRQDSAGSPVPSPRMPLARLRRWGRGLLERHREATFFGSGYDLYHEPNFIPEPSDLLTLSTLHDLSVLLHPEWHPAERNDWYQENFQRALAQCRHFLAVSDFTRQQVIRVLGVAPERVTRVHNGCRPECRPLPAATVARRLRQLQLPYQYLLFVGTVEPRKNVLRLLQAYCGLPGPVRDRWPLLLAGPWGWNAGPIADYYDRQARQGGVRHLGYVRDDDLVVLYNGARALVYPSLYEGFGLPVAEMLACGGAVIASTADALREVAGGCAHYVEPEDVDGLRDAILRVVTDDDWHRELRHGAVERAGLFTWGRAARETLDVYRRLRGGASHRAKAA